MKTHQLVLAGNRRAIGIARTYAPGPSGFKVINGQTYQWNGSAWTLVTPSHMRRQALPFWWKLFHGIPSDGHLAHVGSTNPSFTVPSGFDVNSAGQPLLDALNNMLTTYPSGAIDEGYKPLVLAFQNAWNADPGIAAVGGNALLDTDGKYGPNVQTAVAAINGGSAPSVIKPSPSGGGGGGTVVVSPPASNSNAVINYWNSLPTWEQWAIGLAGVGGAVVVGNALWQKHGGTVRTKVRTHAGNVHRALKVHAARMHARLRRRPA